MNKKRFYLTFTLNFSFQIGLYAAPSDYGRDFHSTSISVTIGQILLAAILMLLAYVGMKSIFKKNKNGPKEKVSKSVSDRNLRIPQNICPKCNGQLFIELGQLSSCRRELSGIDRGELIIYWEHSNEGPVEYVKRVCPVCKGKGVVNTL